MPYFTSKLKTPLGILNFYFNRIFTAEGIRYHVSVIDHERKAHSFNMEETGEVWKLVNGSNCPDWITILEKEIEQAILKHLELST